MVFIYFLFCLRSQSASINVEDTLIRGHLHLTLVLFHLANGDLKSAITSGNEKFLMMSLIISILEAALHSLLLLQFVLRSFSLCLKVKHLSQLIVINVSYLSDNVNTAIFATFMDILRLLLQSLYVNIGYFSAGSWEVIRKNASNLIGAQAKFSIKCSKNIAYQHSKSVITTFVSYG